MMQAKFVKETALSKDLYEHQFLVQGTALFSAGQYQTIEVSSELRFGPFSILSTPQDLPYVKFLSRHKLQLDLNQLVKLTPAQGHMVRLNDVNQYTLIAGGTGLTPFISLISAYPEIHFKLFWSYKNESDLQLIDTYLADRDNLTLETHLFTGENLSSFMQQLTLENKGVYYLAGPYIFVEKVGQYLKENEISSLVSDMKKF